MKFVNDFFVGAFLGSKDILNLAIFMDHLVTRPTKSGWWSTCLNDFSQSSSYMGISL